MGRYARFDAHDGLLLKNLFAAYGYGGNGITFSLLAAELISVLMAGRTSPLLDDLAIDRSAPSPDARTFQD
jgi:glycine/D-amino acid oxidase-like deaminating enzyme